MGVRLRKCEATVASRRITRRRKPASRRSAMTRQSSAGVSPDLFDARAQRVPQREEELPDSAASGAVQHDSLPQPAERPQNRIFRHAIETTFIAAIFLAVAGFGGTEPVSWAIS